jgi:hypothetical protein
VELRERSVCSNAHAHLRRSEGNFSTSNIRNNLGQDYCAGELLSRSPGHGLPLHTARAVHSPIAIVADPEHLTSSFRSRTMTRAGRKH